ncbi:MAG TPA: hypothetical protein VEI46_05545 [Thermodesulfovibrionales bacterium]|nr:hypothetical protein [Thermodesulfovibrionales bacterium]
MNILIGIMFVLLFPLTVFSQGKVYTNEDLERYIPSSPQPSVVYYPRTIEPMREKKNVSIIPPIIEERKIDRPVLLETRGCPTLQDSLDGRSGGSGGGVVEIMSGGRTLQEICDSVGRGCRYCQEVAGK